MFKQKARHQQRPETPQRRKSRSSSWKAALILGLMLCLGAGTLILARLRAASVVPKTKSALTAPAPPEFSSASPSKEYIYGGDRLLATEEPTTTSLAPALINLALNRAATQSSDYPAAGITANKAVNGQTSDTDLTHTQLDAQAWWQVDLGNIHFIESVKLWNRVNCCQERLSNFYIFVSDVPFASIDVTATLNQAGVSSYYTNGAAAATLTRSVNRTGRYVRVQLTGTNYLSLAEVEVFGTANLAASGVATQSSDYPAQGITADKAINGSFADVTHTQFEAQPWWQVDLGSVQSLSNIKLWNRPDCCQSRLSNFYVFISDNPFPSASPTQTQGQAGVASYYVAGQAASPSVINLNYGQRGRYVRIQLAGSNYLSLVEVQVWGAGASSVP
jgi:hypothetical protein